MPTVNGLDSLCRYTCDLSLSGFTQIYKSGLFCMELQPPRSALGCNTFLSNEGLDPKLNVNFKKWDLSVLTLLSQIHLYQTEPSGSYPTPGA